MSTALIPSTPPPVQPGPAAVLLGFWQRKLSNENTRASYAFALKDLAGFMQAPSLEAAVAAIVRADRRTAAMLAESWKAGMIERGLQPSTVNARLAALRSLLDAATELDLIDWQVKVKDLPTRTYRDTRGPGLEAFAEMFRLAADNADLACKNRNLSILRLAFDLGLRAGEIVSLDLAHLDLAESRLWIHGKGRTQREPLTLPLQTATALKGWLRRRGDKPGPLFTIQSNHGRGKRITRQTVFRLVRELGEAAGVKTSPHKIRHLSITEVARDDDLLVAQRFARHTDPKITMRYLDNVEDLAGKAAKKLADKLQGTEATRKADWRARRKTR